MPSIIVLRDGFRLQRREPQARKEVNRRTGGVHSPVQIHPLALNPDVGFIRPPTVVGWFESPTQTLFHFRAIALDPPPDGDVIGAQAPLDEQLFDVAVRKGNAQVSSLTLLSDGKPHR